MRAIARLGNVIGVLGSTLRCATALAPTPHVLTISAPIDVTACASTRTHGTYCAAIEDGYVLGLRNESHRANARLLAVDRAPPASWCGASPTEDAAYCVASHGMMTAIVRVNTSDDRVTVLPSTMCFGCHFSRACAFTSDALVCAPAKGSQAMRLELATDSVTLIDVPPHAGEYVTSCLPQTDRVFCVSSGSDASTILQLGPGLSTRTISLDDDVVAAACASEEHRLVCALRGDRRALVVDAAVDPPGVALVEAAIATPYTPSSFLAFPHVSCATLATFGTVCAPFEAPYATRVLGTAARADGEFGMPYMGCAAAGQIGACVSARMPSRVLILHATTPHEVLPLKNTSALYLTPMRVCARLGRDIVCFASGRATTALHLVAPALPAPAPPAPATPSVSKIASPVSPAPPVSSDSSAPAPAPAPRATTRREGGRWSDEMRQESIYGAVGMPTRLAADYERERHREQLMSRWSARR